MIIYADDLVLIAKDKHGLQVKLQLGMNALYGYCIENDLTVNTNKSHMHVSRRKSTNQPEIYRNDTPVTWVDSFRYLGVIISRTKQSQQKSK